MNLVKDESERALRPPVGESEDRFKANLESRMRSKSPQRELPLSPDGESVEGINVAMLRSGADQYFFFDESPTMDLPSDFVLKADVPKAKAPSLSMMPQTISRGNATPRSSTPRDASLQNLTPRASRQDAMTPRGEVATPRALNRETASSASRRDVATPRTARRDVATPRQSRRDVACQVVPDGAFGAVITRSELTPRSATPQNLTPRGTPRNSNRLPGDATPRSMTPRSSLSMTPQVITRRSATPSRGMMKSASAVALVSQNS